MVNLKDSGEFHVEMDAYRLVKDQDSDDERLLGKRIIPTRPPRYVHATLTSADNESRSWTRIGIAIVSGALLLPVMVGAPLLIAIELARRYPLQGF